MITINISGIQQSSKIINKYVQNSEKFVSKAKVGQKADKVELTQESKSFSVAFKEAKEAMSKGQQENVDKIKDIERQIASGEYSVSGYDVARKILFD